MAAPSCIPHAVSRRFATQVVDKLSDEQKNKFGITDDNKEDAIEAIKALVERHINAETNPDRKDQMLQNPEGFIADLEKYFSVVRVPEDNIEEAQKQFESVKSFLEGQNMGRLVAFEFAEDKESQEQATIAETFFLSHNLLFKEGVSFFKELYSNGKTKTISIVLMEPQRMEDKTAQEKTLDTINKIKNSSQIEIYNTSKKGETMLVSTKEEMPEGWKPTGRYLYDGKMVKAQGVTKDIDNTPYTGSVLAGPIGNSVDTTGRLFFNKNSELWGNDGHLVSNKELQDIIDTRLGGIFTLSGLKNLIKDFEVLEKQLKEKWGKDIIILSDEIRMFGQKPEDGSWIIGYPDLLVIDKKGVVHTLDFKTSKMTDIKGYVYVFHDEKEQNYHTGEHYGKQISRYIKMEESYGLPVDSEPYVVLIDTWYDASDTIEKRDKGAKPSYQTEGTIGFLDDTGSLTMSLGEYAAENPTTRKELLLYDTEKEILYMEPRLHLNITEEEGTYIYSDELAALRGKEDIPFDSEVSYEQQWTALSEEEKEELQWLFNAKPVVFRTAQGIVTLSEDDIEGKPELISSQEIQDVAEFMMYRVSRIITDLQKGKSYSEIPLSNPNENGFPSTVFIGKNRADIIRIAGIDNLIDLAFKHIKMRYKSDFPTEQQYKDGDYDQDEDVGYIFKDKADFLNQKE